MQGPGRYQQPGDLIGQSQPLMTALRHCSWHFPNFPRLLSPTATAPAPARAPLTCLQHLSSRLSPTTVSEPYISLRRNTAMLPSIRFGLVYTSALLSLTLPVHGSSSNSQALVNAEPNLLSPYVPLSGSVSCPIDGPMSCHNNTPIAGDNCCFVYPGGRMLLTQFWDAEEQAPGSDKDWTIHGLWYLLPLASCFLPHSSISPFPPPSPFFYIAYSTNTLLGPTSATAPTTPSAASPPPIRT